MHKTFRFSCSGHIRCSCRRMQQTRKYPFEWQQTFWWNLASACISWLGIWRVKQPNVNRSEWSRIVSSSNHDPDPVPGQGFESVSLIHGIIHCKTLHPIPTATCVSRSGMKEGLLNAPWKNREQDHSQLGGHDPGSGNRGDIDDNIHLMPLVRRVSPPSDCQVGLGQPLALQPGHESIHRPASSIPILRAGTSSGVWSFSPRNIAHLGSVEMFVLQLKRAL